MNYVYMVVVHFTNPETHESGYARLTYKLSRLMDRSALNEVEEYYQASEEVASAVVINYELLHTEDA